MFTSVNTSRLQFYIKLVVHKYYARYMSKIQKVKARSNVFAYMNCTTIEGWIGLTGYYRNI